MISSSIQHLYDAHIAHLSAGERLRLVELITRGMAEPQRAAMTPAETQTAREGPGWQAGERRGDRADWHDRAL